MTDEERARRGFEEKKNITSRRFFPPTPPSKGATHKTTPALRPFLVAPPRKGVTHATMKRRRVMFSRL